MRIPRIEAPQFSARTLRKDPLQWLHEQLQGSVALADMDDVGSPFEAGTRRFRTVALRYSLNACDGLEEMRRLLSHAHEVLHPRGRVVAIARALDSGQELAERMVESGIAPEDLGISNLTNKEITCLRPTSCVFLPGVKVLTDASNSRNVDEFVRDVRKSKVNLELRGELPRRFVTKTLDVGLTWGT